MFQSVFIPSVVYASLSMLIVRRDVVGISVVWNVMYRALQPPGWTRDWHIGVRVIKSKKLIGFISGVPANIRVYNQWVTVAYLANKSAVDF